MLLLGLDYDYDNLDEPTSKDARTDKIEAYAIDFPSKVDQERRGSARHGCDRRRARRQDQRRLSTTAASGTPTRWSAASWGCRKTTRGTYFDRYLVFRINAAKDLINAIGGVDVPVTETMNYDDNWGHLHIHFKPGLTHMDGDQAVSYMRFRHDACSDPCRIKRQQQVERITIEKLKGDKFNDLTHIARADRRVAPRRRYELHPDEMKSARVGVPRSQRRRRASDADPVPRRQGARLLRRRARSPTTPARRRSSPISSGRISAATPPPSADALAAVKPSDLRVDVRNGSGIPGLGAKVADVLARATATSSTASATPTRSTTTRPRSARRSKTPFAGERVRSDIHLAQATVTPIPDSTASASAVAPGKATAVADVTVVVGRDYVNVPSAVSVTEVKRLARVAVDRRRRRWRLTLRRLSRLPALAAAAAGRRAARRRPRAAASRPRWAARVRHAFLGSAADGRIAGPKLIALTFDDGPYPVDTPMLLAVAARPRTCRRRSS